MTFPTIVRALRGVAAALLMAGLAAPLTTAPTPAAAQVQAAVQPAAGSVFLQLGSFRNPTNATRALNDFSARAALSQQAQGFVERRLVGGVVYHRVRIGPFTTPALANQALRQAQLLGMAEAKLMAPNGGMLAGDWNPAAATATIPAPGASVVLQAPIGQPQGVERVIAAADVWRYVQVGATNNLEEANTLLNRARATDAAADGVIHSIRVRGGALHRVLVGPYRTDIEAATAADRLAAAGLVAAVPSLNPVTAQPVLPIAPSAIETARVPTTTPAAQTTPTGPLAAARMPYLTVGTYRLPSNAHRALDELNRAGLSDAMFGVGFLETVNVNGVSLSRVTFGPITSQARAAQALAMAQNLGYTDARVVTPNAAR